jgi:hypothetical protein
VNLDRAAALRLGFAFDTHADFAAAPLQHACIAAKRLSAWTPCCMILRRQTRRSLWI